MADKLTHSIFLTKFAFQTNLNGIISNGNQGT
jgi:hypothetical protein